MNDDIEDVIMQLRSVQNGYAAKRAALKAELDKIDLEYKRADRACDCSRANRRRDLGRS